MSNKVPQIRFNGYSDAWVQRKLSEVTERVTRKNKNNESTRPLTISAQDGLIDQNDFFDKQVASRDVSGYFLVKNGEFAYNKSYSNGYPWGAIKRLDHYDMGVLSTLYIVFKPTNVSSQFLVSYYDTTKWYKEVAKNAAEGARNHGLLNIAPSDFFSTVLEIPTSIEEQDKIGDFLKKMDNLIAANQRKLDLLKEQKKGYLQKMFPKNGAKVPELRFAGFADDWEERKLGDEFKKVSERNDGSFGRNHWISVAKMYFQRPEKVQSNNIDTRTYVMREGDIAFEGHPNSEFKFGRFVANDIGAGVVSELFPIYRHQHEYDNNYWKNAIQIERTMAPIFAKSITSSGNSSNKLDTKHFLRQKILIPQINEQKKIGSFFKQLDDTIALHQRKLDLLKEQKAGFLQIMFV